MADKYTVSFNSDTSDSEDDGTQTESESDDVTEVSLSLPRQPSPAASADAAAEEPMAEFTLNVNFEAPQETKDEKVCEEFTFNVSTTDVTENKGEPAENVEENFDMKEKDVIEQDPQDILHTTVVKKDDEEPEEVNIDTSSEKGGLDSKGKEKLVMDEIDTSSQERASVCLDMHESVEDKENEVIDSNDTSVGIQETEANVNIKSDVDQTNKGETKGEENEEMTNQDEGSKKGRCQVEPLDLKDLSRHEELLEKASRTPTTKRRLLSDEALNSPTRKSVADDDDFEARISRAKAFIESTKKKEEVSSSTGSEKDELLDNPDQYILGTAAVTIGDINPEDRYTEEDIQAVRPKKKFSFEAPDLVKRERKTRNGPRYHSLRKDPYDPENTDELIKRILAESRGEAYVPPEEEPMHDDGYEDNGYGAQLEDNSISLLERRIQSMKKRNAELAADNFDPRPSQKRYNFDDSGTQMALLDDQSSMVSAALPKKAKSGWRKQHQECIDDDDVFEDPNQGALVPYVPPEEEEEHDDPDEDPIYKTRRALRKQFALPDAAFLPQKSEDTDDIVREKSAGIRNVISKQENILQDLRKASQSFDEIDDEIKQIREQFYESQERHAILQEEIQFDLDQVKQREEEQAAQAYARKYAPLPSIDYTKGFIPTQAPKALTWEKEEDLDEGYTQSPMSSRRLALTSSAWAGPGTRLSQTLDYGRDYDADSTVSMPAYTPRSHRPFSAGNRMHRSLYDRSKARSMMEDRDSEFNDDESSRMSFEDEEIPRGHKEVKRPVKYGINMSDVDHDMEELSAKINAWRSKMAVDMSNPQEENGMPNSKQEELVNGADADSSDSGVCSNGSRPSVSYEVHAGKLENGESLENGRHDADEMTGYSWRRSRASSLAPEAPPKMSSYSRDPVADWRSSASKYGSNSDSWKRYSRDADAVYSPKYGSYASKTLNTESSDSGYSSPLRSSRYGASSSSSSDYSRPSRFSRARSCEPSSGFKSKFLDKVRDRRVSGESGEKEKREKPFKSRFLRSNFDSATTSAEA